MARIDESMELWRPAQCGGVEAYTRLRQIHHGRVCAELRRRCAALCPCDVEDLEQEVWIAVWAALPRFQGHSTFDTWLIGVTKHVLWAWLRRQHTAELKLLRQRLNQPEERAGLDEPPPLEHLCTHEAIQQLPELEGQVITLRYFQQCTDREIAVRLQLPLGTVKGRIRSGLLHLRQSWR